MRANVRRYMQIKSPAAAQNREAGTITNTPRDPPPPNAPDQRTTAPRKQLAAPCAHAPLRQAVRAARDRAGGSEKGVVQRVCSSACASARVHQRVRGGETPAADPHALLPCDKQCQPPAVAHAAGRHSCVAERARRRDGCALTAQAGHGGSGCRVRAAAVRCGQPHAPGHRGRQQRCITATSETPAAAHAAACSGMLRRACGGRCAARGSGQRRPSHATNRTKMARKAMSTMNTLSMSMRLDETLLR